jgi:uncharacterized protein
MDSSFLSIDDIKAKIPELLEQVPYLKLLVLFGSRARGDHQESSDWDFAMLFDEDLRKQYEPGGGWNCYRSWVILQRLLDLGDDEMDWIDLKDSSELLAHSISRDGVVLHCSESHLFEDFRRKFLLSKEQLKAIRDRQKERIAEALARWKS